MSSNQILPGLVCGGLINARLSSVTSGLKVHSCVMCVHAVPIVNASDNAPFDTLP